MSTDRKIAKASALLIVISGFGYLLGLVKEIMVANYFGIGGAMDAFYAALTLPSMLNNMLLAIFSAVFIPIYIRYREQGREEANRIAASAINCLLLLLSLGALLLFILAPFVIRSCFRTFTPATMAQAAGILRVLCLTVVLSGLTGAMTGIINAQQSFFWPALSQMYITIGTILCIVILAPSAGVYSLAYGLCAGLLAQCIFLIPVAKKAGYRHCYCLSLNHPALAQMFHLALVFFIAIIAGQVNIAVNVVMASYLSPGSVAALGYANKLIQVPIVVFTGALATAVYPFFSAQVARDSIDEMKRSLARSIRTAACIFMPLTVMLALLGKQIIALLFQRGAFDQHATDLTSAIFICYSFQLLFYTIGIISMKAFLAFQEMATLAKAAVVGVITNVILNLILVRIVTPPAAGIALSTSCVQVLIMCILLGSLRKRIGGFHGAYIANGIARIAVGSLCMGGAMCLLLRISHGMIHSSSYSERIIGLGIVSFSGCALFALLAYLLNVEEVRRAGSILYDRFRRIT
ncbi:MAG: murein biosynthesis integral membrane protein MurJ [Candidatus Aureabacteria bacterium]|nr:murein biosynthesis integral membrane protein MurJ [Candidatus Auribacterota bacterium]